MSNYFQLYTISFFLFLIPHSFAQQIELNFNDILSEADELSSKGKYDEALLLYENAVQIVPDTISIMDRKMLYNKLTKKYAYLGLFDEAKKRTRELFFGNEDIPNQDWLHSEGTCLFNVYEALQENYINAMNFSAAFLALPDNEGLYHCVFRTYALAGYNSEAMAQLAQLLERYEDPLYILYLTYLSKVNGDIEMTEKLMQKVQQIKALVESGKMKKYDERVLKYGLAMVAVLEDDHKEAINYLKESYKLGDKRYYWWKNFNVIFQELENYPEYQELLGKMKSDIDQMRENYLIIKSS